MPPGRDLVYRAPDSRTVQQRAAALQRAGYSKADAVRKATAEGESQAWSYDDSNAWADEKQREERDRQSEQMEKDLSRLDLR